MILASKVIFHYGPPACPTELIDVAREQSGSTKRLEKAESPSIDESNKRSNGPHLILM